MSVADEEIQKASVEKWEALRSRWKTPVTWILSLFGLLLIYVFVYPALFGVVDNSKLFRSAPKWMHEVLQITVQPLIYLDQNVDFYKAYIKWLGDLMGM